MAISPMGLLGVSFAGSLVLFLVTAYAKATPALELVRRTADKLADWLEGFGDALDPPTLSECSRTDHRPAPVQVHCTREHD